MENIVVSIRHCDGCDKLFGPAVLEIKSKTANSWPILEHVEEICYLPQSLMIKIKSNRNENLLLSATITHTLFDQVLFVTYQEAEVPAQDPTQHSLLDQFPGKALTIREILEKQK